MSKKRPNAKITPPPSKDDDLDMLTKLQNEKRGGQQTASKSSTSKSDASVKDASNAEEELRRIGLRFPASVVQRLKVHCALTDRTQNDVVLDAVTAFLDENGQTL